MIKSPEGSSGQNPTATDLGHDQGDHEGAYHTSGQLTFLAQLMRSFQLIRRILQNPMDRIGGHGRDEKRLGRHTGPQIRPLGPRRQTSQHRQLSRGEPVHQRGSVCGRNVGMCGRSLGTVDLSVFYGAQQKTDHEMIGAHSKVQDYTGGQERSQDM